MFKLVIISIFLSMSFSSISEERFEGVWGSPCLKYGEMESKRYFLKLENNRLVTDMVDFYGDSCAIPIKSHQWSGRFDLVEESKKMVSDGEIRKFYANIFIQHVVARARNYMFVDMLNDREECESNNWSTDYFINVAGRFCDKRKMTSLNTRYYNVLGLKVSDKGYHDDRIYINFRKSSHLSYERPKKVSKFYLKRIMTR